MKNIKKPKPKTLSSQPQPAGATKISCSADVERQFEVELCWCIQQLQNALSSGKLNAKQIQDHKKALNVLMSKQTPLIQKRQTMRLSFGDYRSKMVAEEKKFNKVNMQIKLSPRKPSTNSKFVKKCASAKGDEFKFNFKVDSKNSSNEIQVPETRFGEMKIDCKDYHFTPSDNSFKFNFDTGS